MGHTRRALGFRAKCGPVRRRKHQRMHGGTSIAGNLGAAARWRVHAARRPVEAAATAFESGEECIEPDASRELRQSAQLCSRIRPDTHAAQRHALNVYVCSAVDSGTGAVHLTLTVSNVPGELRKALLDRVAAAQASL